MNRVLALQQKFKKLPFGEYLFSFLVARNAPYFLSIKPHILKLESNFCQVKMKKRRRVENHLKTIHAIAMCNLCELTGGLCLEATIPKAYRWIPFGMQVNYLKKAKTDLVATCKLDIVDWSTTDTLSCFVSVKDTDNVEVMNASIDMKISRKQKS